MSVTCCAPLPLLHSSRRRHREGRGYAPFFYGRRQDEIATLSGFPAATSSSCASANTARPVALAASLSAETRARADEQADQVDNEGTTPIWEADLDSSQNQSEQDASAFRSTYIETEVCGNISDSPAGILADSDGALDRIAAPWWELLQELEVGANASDAEITVSCRTCNSYSVEEGSAVVRECSAAGDVSDSEVMSSHHAADRAALSAEVDDVVVASALDSLWALLSAPFLELLEDAHLGSAASTGPTLRDGQEHSSGISSDLAAHQADDTSAADLWARLAAPFKELVQDANIAAQAANKGKPIDAAG